MDGASMFIGFLVGVVVMIQLNQLYHNYRKDINRIKRRLQG